MTLDMIDRFGRAMSRKLRLFLPVPLGKNVELFFFKVPLLLFTQMATAPSLP
jgi:hypothetical protein